MKQKRLDISVLLVVTLLVCAVMGLVRGLTQGNDDDKNHFPVALAHAQEHTLVPEEILYSLQPLLRSRNIGMLAGAVNRLNPHLICSLASLIVSDKQSPLDQEDKLSFLLMLAHRNNSSKGVQFKLFDLMFQAHLFNKHLLVLAGNAQKDYMAILPAFLTWIQKEKTICSTPLLSSLCIEEKSLIDNAFYHAIEQDDLSSLEMLSACGIRIDAQKASDLLVRVVYDRKKTVFIPFLIHRGADVNRIGPDRYTLLSKAVFYNDSVTARTLLEAGADGDLQVDDTIGSARHIARIAGNQELEKLLNSYTTKG